MLSVPLAFESDDDYLSLHPSNPAYYAVCADQNLYHQYQSASGEEKDRLLPALEASRLEGLKGYHTILRMVDAVIVTNEILARTIYPFNKNVVVFQNNIEKLYPWRDSVDLRQLTNANGRFEIPNTMGFFTVPNHASVEVSPGKFVNKDYVRVGYSTSPSRKGNDWLTVKDSLNEWSKRTKQEHMFVMIEDARDNYFYNTIENKNIVVSIPYTPYDKYIQNYRNIDIALAPLEPTAFNTSRSEIKLLEAASWKIPSLVPHLQTYLRTGDFVDGVSCMTYKNEREFIQKLELLATNKQLRESIGLAAFNVVKSKRMEYQHAQRRYDFYQDLINSKKPLKRIVNA